MSTGPLHLTVYFLLQTFFSSSFNIDAASMGVPALFTCNHWVCWSDTARSVLNVFFSHAFRHLKALKLVAPNFSRLHPQSRFYSLFQSGATWSTCFCSSDRRGLLRERCKVSLWALNSKLQNTKPCVHSLEWDVLLASTKLWGRSPNKCMCIAWRRRVGRSVYGPLLAACGLFRFCTNVSFRASGR